MNRQNYCIGIPKIKNKVLLKLNNLRNIYIYTSSATEKIQDAVADDGGILAWSPGARADAGEDGGAVADWRWPRPLE